MGYEHEMTEATDDQGRAVDVAEPSPRLEREVEPETLVSTVEQELTVIPEVESRPEPQDDTKASGSPGGAFVEVEVDGEVPADGRGPQVVAAAAPLEVADAPGRHRTHGRLKTWVIVAAALAGLAVAAFAATYSPIFAADAVRVEGAEHLSAAQVRRIAKVQPGVNVFRLDARQAERRLERNAWVAEAAITTTLPSTVTIEIRERAAAAVAVTDAAGGRSIIAGDGTILARAPDTVELPLVEGADGVTVPSEGQRSLGAKVAASLPAVIAHSVESVQAGADGTVMVILAGGVPVSYGEARALTEKGQALQAVLRWAERTGVHLGSIDVRTPGAPTARLAGATTVVRGPDLPTPGTPISADEGASPTA